MTQHSSSFSTSHEFHMAVCVTDLAGLMQRKLLAAQGPRQAL
jgi:hypothetical protein